MNDDYDLLNQDLRRCREELEWLKKTMKEHFIPRPLFIESLVDDFLETAVVEEHEFTDRIADKDRRVKEHALRKKIEDAMYDLFVEHQTVLPFTEVLKRYVFEKERAFPSHVLKRTENLRRAFYSPITLFIQDKELRKRLETWYERARTGTKDATTEPPPSLPTLFRRLGTRVLPSYYLRALLLFEGILMQNLMKASFSPHNGQRDGLIPN